MADEPQRPEAGYCALIDILGALAANRDFSVEFRAAAVQERNRLKKLVERYGPP
jgi:hypothetical protein